MTEQQDTAIIQTESPTSPQTFIIQIPAQVIMYNIPEQELDGLISSSPSLSFGFLGLGAGAFSSFLAILLSVNLGDRSFATIVALTVLAGTGCLFFGIQAYREHRRGQTKINEIKSRHRITQ